MGFVEAPSESPRRSWEVLGGPRRRHWPTASPASAELAAKGLGPTPRASASETEEAKEPRGRGRRLLEVALKTPEALLHAPQTLLLLLQLGRRIVIADADL